MNKWFYRLDSQQVGPFDREVLCRLKTAGVIDDQTPVKRASEDNWHSFEEFCAREEAGGEGSGNSEDIPAARFYYLDAGQQPVGPFGRAALRQLYDSGIITAATPVSGQGDAAWVNAGQFFGIRSEPPPPAKSGAPDNGSLETPRYRNFDQYAALMGITLTFYAFYLVPTNSRDMKSITGRPRIEFTHLLVFGILTLGMLLLVIVSLWAYDLEKHGRARGTPGRQESLGTFVLILTILSVVIAFFSGGLAFILSGVLNAAAVWLLQKEINLYAKPLRP